MIDLGKGVSVDFLKHPYVFGIEGWDPIRIQKGTGRITGVSLEQLKIIIRTIQGSANEQKPDNGLDATHKLEIKTEGNVSLAEPNPNAKLVLKEKKNEQKPNNADVVKTTTRKNRTTRSRSSKPSKSYEYKS